MYKVTNKKKGLTVLGTGALALAGGGVALAYWTSSGSGDGSATTGTSVNVTVVQTSDSSGLYPGGSVALVGDFNNTNSGAVRVGTVTATVGTLPAGCVAGDFSITGTAVVNADIPSGSGVGAWSGITLGMNNTGVSQDSCKSQTIPVVYSVS